MGWYRVVKTIKGHRYIYEQRTWREGKHVRTESRYVGPADDSTPLGPISGEGRRRQRRADQAAAAVNTTTELDPVVVEQVFTTLRKPLTEPHDRTLPWVDRVQGENLVRPHPAAETVIARLGTLYTHRTRGAFYNPGTDVLNIPPQASFIEFKGETATQSYYGTLFHELAHWTGHPSRLNRLQNINFFGSRRYAREELVAEATAILLMQHFDMQPADLSMHVGYFQSWLSRAGDQEEALAFAREEAQRAARYILSVNTT